MPPQLHDWARVAYPKLVAAAAAFRGRPQTLCHGMQAARGNRTPLIDYLFAK